MFSVETFSFIKWFLHPSAFFHTLFYWWKIFGRILLKKLDLIMGTKIYQFIYYPSYLKEMTNLVEPYTYNAWFLKNFEATDCRQDVNSLGMLEPVVIKLSTIELICENIPDWFKEFEDQENTFSLHRWGWLLMLAVESLSVEIKKWGIRVMKDWVLKMKDSKGHSAWESYSTSERIANALLFFYVLRKYPCIADEDLKFLEQGLMEMASHVIRNLEFHGELTNNHVLNNARALYMLGRLSGCENIANIGRKIFIEETPRMITPSGFLREDSASYHLLLLRTYLEVLWAADYTGDVLFSEKIKPFVASMAKAADFLSIYDNAEKNWSIPLIGDVTPDFPSSWLDNIFRSRPAMDMYCPTGCNVDFSSGWNGIWKT